MEKSNRQDKVIRNVSAQMVASLIQSLLGFVSRKIFLDCLGQDLLGLNSLLTSIIGMLSLAELGIAETINFSLYAPLAKDDREQVASIMRLYRKLYSIIGAVVAVLGIAVFPFLDLLVESNVSMETVYWAYGLFLLGSVSSYYVAYKRSLIIADQKDYIVTNVDTVAQIILTVVEIAALLITGSFFLYLVLKILIPLLRNIYLSWLADKYYPYAKKKAVKPLSKEYMSQLASNIKALFTIRFASFCVSGTDNMLLSGFVDLAAVAIYNNYVTVINMLNKTFNMIFSKAISVIGNYLVLNGKENSYTLFKRIFFTNFVITSYTTIGITVVCNAVITAWLGADQTWGIGMAALLAYNNYARYILQTCESFRSAAGLYSPKPFVKFLALFEGILNLIASLSLIWVMNNDIAAVFLGTCISTVVSTVAVPWIVYRFLFARPLREFFWMYFKYFFVMVVALVGSSLLFRLLMTSHTFINVCIGILVCTVVTGGLYLIFFGRTDEFKYNLTVAKRLLHKKIHK